MALQAAMRNLEGHENGNNSPTQVVEDYTGLLDLSHITEDVSLVAPTVRMPADLTPRRPPFSVEIHLLGDRVEYVLLDRLYSVPVYPDGAVRADPHMKILTANKTTLQGTQWVILSHDDFTLKTGSLLVARVDGSGTPIIETQPRRNFSAEVSDLTRDERAVVQKIITALLQGVPTQLLNPGIPSASVAPDQVFDDEDQIQQFFMARIYGENPGADIPNGVWRRGRHDVESHIRKVMCEHDLTWEAAERIVTRLNQLDRHLD